MDLFPLLAGLASVCGIVALWCLIPELPPWGEDGGPQTVDEEPEPLLGKLRGHGALALNTFPRQHDRACSSCHGRALVWTKDNSRHDAWTGLCRRCGTPRLDVVAGVSLER